MIRLLCRPLLAALVLGLLSGCATLSGEPTQKVNIQTVDAEGKTIDGMSCRASNTSALIVECRREGYPMARGVVVSRAVDMQLLQMLLPGGSSLMVVDHLTGYMYAYPRWVRLQVGTDMVFDRRDEVGRGPTPGLITRQFDDFVRFASTP
jgi:hypothetical protein